MTDRTIAQAAGFVVAGEPRWRTCQNPSTADVVVVGPEPPPADGASRRLLVALPSPAGCGRAVAAFLDGTVQAVVSSDELDQLPLALDALDRGLGAVSRTTLVRARGVPALTGRQERVLRGVLAAQPNRMIGRSLQLSEATVKREVSELMRLFRATSRLALAQAASAAGFAAIGRRP